MAAPEQTLPTGQPAAAPVAGQPTAAGGGGGDMLDKGLDFLSKKSGHAQSHSTIEKASDGVRSLFKKATGKDVPIADKTYE